MKSNRHPRIMRGSVMKRLWLLLLVAALLLVSGCRKEEEEPPPNPVATITLTDGSVMRIQLYPNIAPNTVRNFIYLANQEHFYDNQQFFRVVSNVFVQAGDPNNKGTGDANYYIAGEFTANGFENNLSHMRGTISMARKANYNTASSQFFIMEGSYPEYDGYYAAFGSIMDEESLNTLDQIGSTPVDGKYLPLERITIQRVRVETYDVDYGEPVKLDKNEVDNQKNKKRK